MKENLFSSCTLCAVFFVCFSFLFLLYLLPSFVLFYLSIDSDQAGACPYSAARAESAFGKVQSREASERVRGKDGKRTVRVDADAAPACSHLYPALPLLPFSAFDSAFLHQACLSFRSH